jgi:hypothetical protein
MADDPQHAEAAESLPRRKKRAAPIRVLPPSVVSMTSEDHQQAVTAIATMIAAWWHDHQHDPDS